MAHNYTPLSEKEERIGTAIVNAAYKIHKTLGPGLLEKVYEACMEYELKKLGFTVSRQVTIPINYDNITFDEGLRLDLLIEDLVLIELKAMDTINSV